MPSTQLAAETPSSSHYSTEIEARRSLRRSAARRSRLARAANRRRRVRAGCAATLGAMTLAAGVATAQDQVGGVGPEAQVPSAATTLRPGDSGPAVVALQKALSIRSDGDYGARTRRAVRRLQRSKHMKADGVARPSVLRALGVDARVATRKAPVPPVLERIAHCESGGDPRAVSNTGRYRGKYQFSMTTWRTVGGTGDPAEASEARQDKLAAKLFADQGRAPWPHCGARV